MNFNLGPFASPKELTHRAASKHWRITIAAEMAEHNTFDFSRQELFQDGGSRGV